MNDIKLPQGEFGYDTDKNELKIGNGKDKFSGLPGLGGGTSAIKFVKGDSIVAGCYPVYGDSTPVWAVNIKAPKKYVLWGFNVNGVNFDMDTLYNLKSRKIADDEYSGYYTPDNRILVFNDTVVNWITYSTNSYNFVKSTTASLSDSISYTVYISAYNTNYSYSDVVVTPIFYTIKIDGEPEEEENNDNEYGYSY